MAAAHAQLRTLLTEHWQPRVLNHLGILSEYGQLEFLFGPHDVEILLAMPKQARSKGSGSLQAGVWVACI